MGCHLESPKKPAPGVVPILVWNRLKAQFRGPHLGENRGQLAKKSFDTGLDLFRDLLEEQISFESGLREIFDCEAFTSKIKKESTQSIMGNRMNWDGYFEPARLIRGWHGRLFLY